MSMNNKLLRSIVNNMEKEEDERENITMYELFYNANYGGTHIIM